MTTAPALTPTSATTNPLSAKTSTADRLQDGVLITIVLLVGIMAGAASFSHVHDWTITNSPTGTPDWFGWANAVISELIPTAALITIGRRRKANTGQSIAYPMVLLVAAVGVSLTAQLAVATPTVFGWMVSALPALAFFALSKLVFSATAPRPTNPVTAPVPATSSATSPDTTQIEVSPAAVRKTRATTPTKKATPAKKTTPRTPAQGTTAPAPAEPTPAATPTVEAPAPVAQPAFAAPLLTNARSIAQAHHDEHGEPITPGQLAVRLRVPTPTASNILTTITDPAPNARPHNGVPVGANQ